MDTNQIREIIAIFEESGLSSLELEEGNLKIKMEKPSAAQVAAEPAPIVTAAPEMTQQKAEEETNITSPLVGTFYRAKSPNDAPYVKEGDHVHTGDVICMIEAMKTMNEIQADKDGIIKKILVENGEMVEYGQPLFTIGEDA